MAMKYNTNTQAQMSTQKDTQAQNQDLMNMQIPTPEELGFEAMTLDIKTPDPLPTNLQNTVMAKDEKKKSFFSKFSSKKEEKPVSIPEIPKMESFSFPKFDENPIQPLSASPLISKSDDTEYLKNKDQLPLEMPKLGEESNFDKLKQDKVDAQTLIDEHETIEDDGSFDSITNKLNDIEEALKKHMEEIEEKMKIVKTIEKDLKLLDVNLKKPNSKPKSQSKKTVSKKKVVSKKKGKKR